MYVFHSKSPQKEKILPSFIHVSLSVTTRCSTILPWQKWPKFLTVPGSHRFPRHSTGAPRAALRHVATSHAAPEPSAGKRWREEPGHLVAVWLRCHLYGWEDHRKIFGKSSKIHKLNGAVWWEKIGKTVIHGHFNGKIIEQNGELSIAMFDSQTVAGLEWGSNLSIYFFGPVWICHINLPAINKISW